MTSDASWRTEFRYLHADLRGNRSIFVRALLTAYRSGRAMELTQSPESIKRASRKLYALVFNCIVIPLGGGELPLKAQIGPNVRFPHRLGGQ